MNTQPQRRVLVRAGRPGHRLASGSPSRSIALLRVPEDDQDYPLPRGLGRLPVHRVEEFAVTIAAGGVNVITGQPATESPSSQPQDYLVVPDQPWLDGFHLEAGVVRQFVAAPLLVGHGGRTAGFGRSERASVSGLRCRAGPISRQGYGKVARNLRQNSSRDPWSSRRGAGRAV